MINGKKYILFLNNRYPAGDNNFYLKLLKGKTTVAVDGGITFFRKNKIPALKMIDAGADRIGTSSGIKIVS